MDRELSLIHVKLRTWFSMQLQVYVNGHEGLVCKLTPCGVRSTSTVALAFAEASVMRTRGCKFGKGQRLRTAAGSSPQHHRTRPEDASH
jgi:hypothetical protein